jgi:hypothetical protein
MQYFMPLLYAASVVGGFVIAKRRGRWVAVPLAVFLPFIGFLFALCLKTRCPFCREYMYPGAKVCPSCGRDLASGSVKVRA